MRKIAFLLFALCLTLLSQAQMQVSKSLSGMTAGGLKAALSAQELTTVTNLTVTGVIDARDFKTMRDDMTMLEAIDLSGVAIAAYTGTAGPVLASVTYPASEVSQYAFSKKQWLRQFKFPTATVSVGKYAFNNCGGLKTLNLPSSLKAIGDNSYDNCSGFVGDLVIPEGCETIGYGAFMSCMGFTGDIIIPNSVTIIGKVAFEHCGGKFTVSPLNLNYSSLEGVLFNKDQSVLIKCPINKTGPYSIPLSVTTLLDGAFYGCSCFTSDLVIPSSVTTIGSAVFESCSGITGSLIIPASVKSIGDFTFTWISNLTNIYAMSEVPINLTLSSSIFAPNDKILCTLYVPKGYINAYKNAPVWKDFLNIVEMAPTTLPIQDSETISIYPNPTSEGFKISGIEGVASVTLIDNNGKLVLAKEVSADEFVSINALPRGVYVARVACGSGLKVEKIVKK